VTSFETQWQREQCADIASQAQNGIHAAQSAVAEIIGRLVAEGHEDDPDVAAARETFCLLREATSRLDAIVG
jgi:hypothetical protein